MKSNRYLIFILFAVLILSISAVNATEIDLDDNLTTFNLNNQVATASVTSTPDKTWTVEYFLSNYNQISSGETILIKNGTGTVTNQMTLSKSKVSIITEGNVILNSDGGNHRCFYVTGSDILIQGITFQNFQNNDGGGAIYWQGINGVLKNCNFNNNKALEGGSPGGGIYWYGYDGTLFACTFTNNYAMYGGGVYWGLERGSLFACTFTNNIAKYYGGGCYWSTIDCNLFACTFTNNTADMFGGGFCMNGGIVSDCNFKANTASTMGGAIHTFSKSSVINCNFINSEWINKQSKTNGIGCRNNLTINNGNGIVDISFEKSYTQFLSGISIIVLNNKTIECSSNTNINFVNNVLNYA